MHGAPEPALVRLESSLGWRLPSALRARLAEENGGPLPPLRAAPDEDWRLIPVLDSTDRKSMRRTAEDIGWWLRRIADRPGAVDGMVPFARTWSERVLLVLLPGSPARLGDEVFRQSLGVAPVALGVTVAEVIAGPPPVAQHLAMRPMPQFRYHPDPVGTGAVKPSAAVCPVCGEVTGHAYATTPYGVGTMRHICPWCIADGTAAARHRVSFCDDFPLLSAGLTAEVVAEVTGRTPGFASFQQEEWQVCCGDACAFEGLLDNAAFAALDDATLISLHVPPGRLNDWRTAYTGSDYGVFAFRCLHCAERKYWVDSS